MGGLAPPGDQGIVFGVFHDVEQAEEDVFDLIRLQFVVAHHGLRRCTGIPVFNQLIAIQIDFFFN